ncbi:MAG: hypothetical protein Q9207_006007 [Kuettlingeria erythrocarpa]
MRSFIPITTGLAIYFGLATAFTHNVHQKQRRDPQDWSKVKYDFSGVDFNKIDYGAPADPVQPAPAPVPAPVVPDTTITSPPVVEKPVDNGGGSGGANGGADGDMTIAITNNHGQLLSLAFDSNAGAPGFRGSPQPTTLAAAATTSYAVPSGWAGRINVGKIDHVDNSKIEGSFYGAGNGDIDISYVDGYSVPITCSVGGKVITGCNIELFDQGCNAPDTPQMGPDGQLALCSNSARVLNDGPPSQFFAACAGAAYTFPNDNAANVGMIQETLMECCIGTSCGESEQQKAKAQKRDVKSPSANAPSLLPRSRKRHAGPHAPKHHT